MFFCIFCHQIFTIRKNFKNENLSPELKFSELLPPLLKSSQINFDNLDEIDNKLDFHCIQCRELIWQANVVLEKIKILQNEMDGIGEEIWAKINTSTQITRTEISGQFKIRKIEQFRQYLIDELKIRKTKRTILSESEIKNIKENRISVLAPLLSAVKVLNLKTPSKLTEKNVKLEKLTKKEIKNTQNDPDQDEDVKLLQNVKVEIKTENDDEDEDSNTDYNSNSNNNDDGDDYQMEMEEVDDILEILDIKETAAAVGDDDDKEEKEKVQKLQKLKINKTPIDSGPGTEKVKQIRNKRGKYKPRSTTVFPEYHRVCGPCQEKFDQGWKYNQHLKTKSHKITIKKLKKNYEKEEDEEEDGELSNNSDEKPDYFCEPCNQSFRVRSSMLLHFKSMSHKKIKELKGITEEDGKIKRRKRKVDNTPNLCELCGLEFTKKYRLKNHIETVHQGIKKFGCDLCDYKTNYQNGLRDHITKEHTENPPQFICDQCPNIYKTQISLNNHLRNVHINDLNRKYICTELECGKKFKNGQTLHMHTLYSHKSRDEWPFKCSHCNKAFVNNYIFKEHLKSHSNELKDSVKCNICEKSYASKLALYYHKFHYHKIKATK